ncbi:MAG: glycosyltransferase family 2 protein [Nitrospirae bacterium]|nr:glycosyltransferase family 2 protein [Nitrospirota bacterium]
MPITIGIPFYNNEATLPGAVRSVFAQTYEDWELILMDDGSSDRSLELARSVKDPRVRVVSDGMNLRLPARLNQIVSEAKYDLISRMDADDMMSPSRFLKQLRFMSDPKIQIVTSGMAMLSADNQPVGYRGGSGFIDMIGLLRGQAIAHAPLLGRRSWFRRNPYDLNCPRSQDAELWCRTYHQGQLRAENVHMISEPLYFCREESGLSLEKVIASHSVLRRLIRQYGPASLGIGKTVLELLRSHARSNALRVAALFGLLPLAAAKGRNRNISDPQMLEKIQSEIAQVLATRVPGLD